MIAGFSEENISTVIKGLNAFEGKSNGLTMHLTLNNNISKTEIYKLLDNTENFNTYLESPLSINGSSVISPSILFVLTASQLSLDEFEQAVTLQSFTVNDLAVAIQNNLPMPYLTLLFAQTESVADMPLVLHTEYSSYNNLADVAVAQHNVPLLKLLETHGVHATNEPGVITGLDIAIMNFPTAAAEYQNLQSFPDKYIETLNYLIEKGFNAHGITHQTDHETIILFKAPFSRGVQSSEILEPKLRAVMNKIALIGSNEASKQLAVDNSLVASAIEAIEIRKSAIYDNSDACQNIQKELLVAEGFIDISEAYKIINDIKNDGENIAERLHEIDPVLVNLWRRANPTNSGSLNNESRLIDLLRAEQYQDALEYSSTTPLTTEEIDMLVFALLQNIDAVLPIWNSRITSKQPSALISFKYFNIKQWHLLMLRGFDFSLQDQYGNDMFLPAALHSEQAVQLLLDNGFLPSLNHLGLDVLDFLLEDSYEKGLLNPSLIPVLTVVKEFELSHFSRVARIKRFFPEEYEKLIKINADLNVTETTEVNKFRLQL
ncbi:hypothetical protein [Rheinheimera sp. MMS21-TC3]|uniref:hypothetical protein n=1 Tax=Rheinheimera sp. MMS21-TC3 TaxID=3072790 RepID=UPI0028C3B55A|nr:hypothetical protein [Rheinheimera sp. MMS21-TC3]WNO60764.1 hypothetical protein RDV63_07315 [Rheinheimera sp. MMS21-TC3]